MHEAEEYSPGSHFYKEQSTFCIWGETLRIQGGRFPNTAAQSERCFSANQVPESLWNNNPFASLGFFIGVWLYDNGFRQHSPK